MTDRPPQAFLFFGIAVTVITTGFFLILFLGLVPNINNNKHYIPVDVELNVNYFNSTYNNIECVCGNYQTGLFVNNLFYTRNSTLMCCGINDNVCTDFNTNLYNVTVETPICIDDRNYTFNDCSTVLFPYIFTLCIYGIVLLAFLTTLIGFLISKLKNTSIFTKCLKNKNLLLTTRKRLEKKMIFYMLYL